MLVTIFIAWGVFFVIAAMINYLAGSLDKTRAALRRAERELIVKERLSEAGRDFGQSGPRDPQSAGRHLGLGPGP